MFRKQLLPSALIFVTLVLFAWFYPSGQETVQAQTTLNLGSIADITGTGAAVALSSTSLRARWVIVTCTATTRFGDSAISATQGIQIPANTPTALPVLLQNNTYYDLSKIYFLVASSNKISIIYGI